MKRTALASLTAILIALSAYAVTAAATTKPIDVTVGRVNLYIDGKKKDLDTFIYEDRTYIQLRELAEAMGAEVGWDDETSIITIDQPTPEPTATPAPTATPEPSPSGTPEPSGTPKPDASPLPAPSASHAPALPPNSSGSISQPQATPDTSKNTSTSDTSKDTSPSDELLK